MKEIPLTQGKVAIVDDDVYESLSCWKWRYSHGYAIRSTPRSLGKRKTIWMHREVVKAPEGMQVDHIRTNEKLINTRENLRICTCAQNSCNKNKYKNNTSGYKGVSWHKRGKRWEACICPKSRTIHLGLFDSPEEAARAYDAKARELFGEFAWTNFEVTI
jgi:hypothetical protein